MLATKTIAALATRRIPGSAIRFKHTVPDLPYDYNELEPVISAKIMQLHHDKHHAAYVAGLNAAEEKLAEAQHRNDLAGQ
ncbi:Superoxide dismutase [Mn], mitochondrial, partial [Coemansia furcata]